MTDNAVRPKLVVAGAARALDWYRDVVDAQVGDRFDIEGSVVFAELRVFGTTLTLKDTDSVDPAGDADGRPGPILDVVLDDPDGVADRMVDAGAETIFPVADQPYGARGGRVRDPFGVQWLLQTPVSLSREEIRAALGG